MKRLTVAVAVFAAGMLATEITDTFWGAIAALDL
jgi:hypothetical protein